MSFTIFLDNVGSVGVTPRTLKMFSTDTYATITTAGYINKVSLPDVDLDPTDWIQASYSNGRGYFYPTINLSTGIITLGLISPTNIPSAVAGNVAIFGTAGALADGGFPRSSSSAVISFAMQQNASTAGHIPVYQNTTGTLTDSGLTPAAVVVAGTSSGSAGDTTNCNAQNAWPFTINGVQYYIPLFTQNT